MFADFKLGLEASTPEFSVVEGSGTVVGNAILVAELRKHRQLLTCRRRDVQWVPGASEKLSMSDPPTVHILISKSSESAVFHQPAATKYHIMQCWGSGKQEDVCNQLGTFSPCVATATSSRRGPENLKFWAVATLKLQLSRCKSP